MGIVSLLKAEVLVFFNCTVVSLVFYGLWTLVTGGVFNPQTLGFIAGVLFVVANVAFVVAKNFMPKTYNTAKVIDEKT